MSKIMHLTAEVSAANGITRRLCLWNFSEMRRDKFAKFAVSMSSDRVRRIGLQSRLCRKCCAKLGLTSKELKTLWVLKEL